MLLLRHPIESKETKIQETAKRIATREELADRVETGGKQESYITLKDHMPNFITNPKVRLINPNKTEIGIISKHKLDHINKQLRSKFKFNQWKNSGEVVYWFNGLTENKIGHFIGYDIVNFYPSIDEELLEEAIKWARREIAIEPETVDIIKSAKHNLLYKDQNPWEKSSGNPDFDVTMGSFDSAETCELIGLYALSCLAVLGINSGLYHDDGLVYSKLTKQANENLKQQICNIYRSMRLQITIEANSKECIFLDMVLNLESKYISPYMKPNNQLKYINKKSNHPPNNLKNLEKGIETRLSLISSSRQIFEECKQPYVEALTKSGFKGELKYNEDTMKANTDKIEGKKNRARHKYQFWLNPPYNGRIKNNLGSDFLNIVEQCFPTWNQLSKIFNRHTVKLSYITMPNIQQTINQQNNKLLISHKEQEGIQSREQQLPCNCRRNTTCPLQGNCRAKDIIYQATVEVLTSGSAEETTGREEDAQQQQQKQQQQQQQEGRINMRRSARIRGRERAENSGENLPRVQQAREHTLTEKVVISTETYIGMTGSTWKGRYGNHKGSFKNWKDRNETTLSQFIWKLKEEGKEFRLKWKIMARAKSYSPITKSATFAANNYLFILYKPKEGTLNKRREVVSM